MGASFTKSATPEQVTALQGKAMSVRAARDMELQLQRWSSKISTMEPQLEQAQGSVVRLMSCADHLDALQGKLRQQLDVAAKRHLEDVQLLWAGVLDDVPPLPKRSRLT